MTDLDFTPAFIAIGLLVAAFAISVLDSIILGDIRDSANGTVDNESHARLVLELLRLRGGVSRPSHWTVTQPTTHGKEFYHTSYRWTPYYAARLPENQP